jgi:hypothetical protein
MRGKKTAQMMFKLTDEELADLTDLAAELRLKPGVVVSAVIAQFIDARREHGGRLVWPPEFDYFVKK